MRFVDGIAVGVALVGLLFGLIRYVRYREQDSLVMAAVSGWVGAAATAAAFAPSASWALAPITWAAVIVAVLVIRRERKQQH